MRRILIVLSAIILSACASILPPDDRRTEDPPPLAPEERDIEFAAPDEHEPLSEDAVRDVFDIGRLGRFEVALIRAAGFETGDSIALDPFVQTELFVHVVDTFDLFDPLSEENLELLFDALTAPVPRGQEGVYRAVLVGQFFDNGGPLYLLLGSYDDDTSREGNRRLVVQSNAVAARDGRAATAAGRFVSVASNISWDAILSDTGAFARTRAVGEGSPPAIDVPVDADESEETTPRLAAIQRIARAAEFLVDGSSQTTAEIPSLVEPLWASPGEPLDIRLAAGFLLMRYSLAQGATGAATDRRDAIVSRSAGATDPEVLRMAQIIVPFYYEVYDRASRR